MRDQWGRPLRNGGDWTITPPYQPPALPSGPPSAAPPVVWVASTRLAGQDRAPNYVQTLPYGPFGAQGPSNMSQQLAYLEDRRRRRDEQHRQRAAMSASRASYVQRPDAAQPAGVLELLLGLAVLAGIVVLLIWLLG